MISSSSSSSSDRTRNLTVISGIYATLRLTRGSNKSARFVI